MEGGTYYVSAGAWGERTGTYTLTVTDLTSSDANNEGTHTTGVVAVGGMATGAIDHGGDRDWFAVVLEAGKTYRFDLEGSSTDAGTLSDPYLRGIHDAEGNLLAGTSDNNAGEGSNASKTFTAVEGGTYYVSAGAWSDRTGTYSLTVTDLTAMDVHTAAMDTAGTVGPDGTATGAINYGGDRDWFAVVLEAGKTYRFDLEGSSTDAGTLSDPYLRGIHDADGNLLAGTVDSNAGEGRNALKTFIAPDSGTYYVSAGAWSDRTGTYTLTVTDLTTSDASPASTDTSGTVVVGGYVIVVVGGYVIGEVDNASERDWYAVEFMAGHTYTIDLLGSRTNDGTVRDPFLVGLCDPSDEYIAGTTNDNGGDGANSHVVFTATESGTYRICAGARGNKFGTYKLVVRDASNDDARPGAVDLGDVTDLTQARFPRNTVDGDSDHIDYYRFTLAEARQVILGLRQQDADADLFLEDATGRVLASSEIAGTANEAVRVTLSPGTYFVRIESQETGNNGYVFRYGVAEPSPQPPSFLAAGYSFDLAENADGSTTPVALGTVSASDLEGASLTYSIAEGDAAGLFVIDASTGALMYTGVGEDHESGPTSYVLTVRGSDGTLYTDVAVKVTVTNMDEAPVFAEDSYTFDLAENTDGSTTPMVLGTVSAIDPEGVSPTYSIVGGNTTGHFAIDPATGALSYTGAGENYESETTRYDVTVRASTGSQHDDVIVAVRVTDVPDLPSISVSDAQAHESDGILRYLVVLDQASSQPVTVQYVTEDGTAVAGEDYEAAFGLLLFAPGQTQKHVEVVLINDRIEDNGEILVLRLSGPVGALLDHSEATGTILNSILNSEVSMTVSETGSDLPATIATVGYIKVGETATGTIDPLGDLDWFAVTLEAGTRYRFELEGSDTGQGTLRFPELRGVYDSHGNKLPVLKNVGGMGLFGLMEYTPDAHGTYYVSAGGHKYRGETGTYSLTVTDLTTVDHQTDGTDTLGTLSVGGTVSGEVDFYEDRDWYAVTLEAGYTYRFYLEGLSTGGGTMRDSFIHGIFDSSGRRIPGTTDDNSGGGFNSRVDFVSPLDGTFYVSVGNAGIKTGTYRLSVSRLGDDFDNGKGHAESGSLVVGESVVGMIEASGDQDWFAVTLVAGQTYRFDLEGVGLSDPYLRGIYDAHGSFIRGTTDHTSGPGSSSRVDFTADQDGIYYVSAGATGDGMGYYRLSVAERPDDYVGDTDTTGVVAVGGSAVGRLTFVDDRDWFAVTLDAGKTYRFDLEGFSTGAGSLPDPHLRGIYDSNGTLIAGTLNDDGGVAVNSRVDFTPAVGGTYYVSVGGNRAGEGTYRISVQEQSGPWRPGALPIVAGGTQEGEISQPRERDWFAVEFVAGRIYQFDLNGSGPDALQSPRLFGIYNSAGDFVPGTSYGGPAPLNFIPTESGTYYVSVGDSSRDTGTFFLEITDVTLSTRDDHPGVISTVASAGQVAVGGSVTGQFDSQQDTDWFAVKLEQGRTYRVEITDGPGFLHGVTELSKDIIPGSAGSLRSVFDYGKEATFVASVTAIHYVIVGAFGAVGAYRVQVKDVTRDLAANEDRLADGHAAGVDTDSSVEVGGSASGTINHGGDRDWFAVSLEAGLTYRFDMQGASTLSGTLLDPYLHGIYDLNGNLLPGTADDDGGTEWNARSTFTPPTAGTYYVSAGAWGDQQGTYTVSVEEVM